MTQVKLMRYILKIISGVWDMLLISKGGQSCFTRAVFFSNSLI